MYWLLPAWLPSIMQVPLPVKLTVWVPLGMEQAPALEDPSTLKLTVPPGEFADKL